MECSKHLGTEDWIWNEADQDLWTISSTKMKKVEEVE